MTTVKSFEQLGMDPKILKAIATLGYEQPSPIQEQSIPILMEGRDILAQAQTGTGKTGAFALPILSRLNLKTKDPQALVLAPTRELAIQVAEAFQSYAKFIPGFHVLPIYGGQDYQVQLRGLKRGTHVVVGTPGRVMDHLRRKTLKTDSLTTLVLDEADEMLRMGFLEDVKWVLEQIKHKHQTALFSATIPDSIRQVSKRFLKDPARVHIEPKTKTLATIEQEYMLVDRRNKLEALTRYFEVEDVDAALIFTGTKVYSVEVADKLAARGYSVCALNGDMTQRARESVIAKLKKGTIDMVVATEVAARGLDVERISHVINLDIPQAAESYIHRIGRTGRAGRSGKALLFVTPREQRMLREIERAASQPIKHINPPSYDDVKEKRAEKFKTDVLSVLSSKDTSHFQEMVRAITSSTDHSELDVAAALAFMAHKDSSTSTKDVENASFEREERGGGRNKGGRSRRGASGGGGRRREGGGGGRSRDGGRGRKSSSKNGSSRFSRDDKKSGSSKKSSSGKFKAKKHGARKGKPVRSKRA